MKLNLPDDVVDAAFACADRAGITRTEFIRRALSVAVALDDYDEVTLTVTREKKTQHLTFPWLRDALGDAP